MRSDLRSASQDVRSGLYLCASAIIYGASVSFTCKMGLRKAQINLAWEDASASVWDHTSLLVLRTMDVR